MSRPTADHVVATVLAAKSLRTYCYGFLGVLFPLHLAGLGLGPEGIGVAVALTLVSSAGLTLAVRRPAERLGSRAVLIGLAALTAVSGLLLATTRSPALVVVAAMLGNLAVSTGETGPFLSIEQVLIARASTTSALTLRLSLYSLVGYGAAGLGALTVSVLGNRTDGWISAPTPLPALAWLFAVSGLVQVLVYARLAAGTPDREDDAAPGRAEGGAAGIGPRRSRVRPLVRRLAALFALDALAGGFVLQSLIAYWLHVRFGLTAGALGQVFFGTQLLAGGSLLVAAQAARRLGLVNTMVFSHLASNVLLIAVALAPAPGPAVALLLLRALLSQIDVPTRQAFLMAVVGDHEREAAATLTNASRTVAQALSPALSGYLMQAVGVSTPFVLGGVLKIVYDLLLYATCRRATLRESR